MVRISVECKHQCELIPNLYTIVHFLRHQLNAVKNAAGATEIPVYEAQYPGPNPFFHYEYGCRWHLQWSHSITLGFYNNGFAPKKKKERVLLRDDCRCVNQSGSALFRMRSLFQKPEYVLVLFDQVLVLSIDMVDTIQRTCSEAFEVRLVVRALDTSDDDPGGVVHCRQEMLI